ncbi:MAG: 30S ribosome-binding factor RbfA [Clostridiales bacterium]|nr:30S ribosome-binding factor RbfA [Clostridiales bacterium]
MRKNSIKNTRINQEVLKELNVLISSEVKDPRIGLMTTVTAVEVASDLKTAKVFISVLGDEDSKKETIKGLKSASSFLRSSLARNLNLRNTPELKFYIDDSLEYGMRMSRLIDSLDIKHEEPEEDE